MPLSQRLSNNLYSETNQILKPISLRSILILFSGLCLSVPKSIFPQLLPDSIFEEFISFDILMTCPTLPNLLKLISLTILGERYKL